MTPIVIIKEIFVKFWKCTLSTLLACSIVSCGGSGSSDESKLSNSDIQQVKAELASLGYTDFSNLTQQQVEQLQTALQNQGFNSSEIDKLFVALNVGTQADEQESDKAYVTDVIEPNLFGYWQNETRDRYLVVGNSSLVEYVDIGGCYQAKPYNVLANQSGQLSLESVVDDTVSSAAFALDGASILAELPGAGTQTYSSVSAIPHGMIGCSNTNSVLVDIDFRALPQSIRNSDTTYRIVVFFDVNRNDKFDVGDFNLIFVKRSSSRSTSTYLQVPSDLSATVSIVNEFSDRLSSRSTPNNAIPALISGNRLSLQANTKQAALLQYLSTTTPFKVTASLDYPSPERTPYPNMTMQDEGPWLWAESSIKHTDSYPSEGYADFTASVYQDDLNDQTGESGWVDIESVTISFN
ncbi:hypothetical protein DS2_07693 [Catenovulum agarivorans DS-2]|uniref:Uncharacterized protein n=1 Tax=Catenovulum agarivorans DS-2 TaxID=1328313 RepID=W7QC88_9ALTE|nr:hypothetical protein DS2_07693 [Catenovulum agarivorans DS-2]